MWQKYILITIQIFRQNTLLDIVILITKHRKKTFSCTYLKYIILITSLYLQYENIYYILPRKCRFSIFLISRTRNLNKYFSRKKYLLFFARICFDVQKISKNLQKIKYTITFPSEECYNYVLNETEIVILVALYIYYKKKFLTPI